MPSIKLKVRVQPRACIDALLEDGWTPFNLVPPREPNCSFTRQSGTAGS